MQAVDNPTTDRRVGVESGPQVIFSVEGDRLFGKPFRTIRTRSFKCGDPSRFRGTPPLGEGRGDPCSFEGFRLGIFLPGV